MKRSLIVSIAIVLALALVLTLLVLLTREEECPPDPGDLDRKPVIYLYPEEECEVDVKLHLEGELTCSYPEYNNGWQVTATPSGTIKANDGREYNYLFWEGHSGTEYDMSRGFSVKGEDSREFLEWALASLGLSYREANEFIVYWLPQLEANPYNVISFQGENYTDAARLEITPEPDTVIRVFMAYYPSDEAVEIPPQELNAPNRLGFTVVEWGGALVK